MIEKFHKKIIKKFKDLWNKIESFNSVKFKKFLDLRVLGGIKFFLGNVLDCFSVFVFDGGVGTIAEKQFEHFKVAIISGIVNRVISFFAELINVKL